MILDQIWSWLTSSSSWTGDSGILLRLQEHLTYVGLTMVFAVAIALPLGTWIAHTGRGSWVLTVANAARAIPSIGLLLVLVLWLQPKFSGDTDLGFLIPCVVALVVLALPPLLAGAYSGVREVDPAARDAAKGMGMTGREVFFAVELPCALPLIMSGIRSATLQVVATATIAAFPGLGGLGRFVIDGIQTRDSAQMLGGAVLVAALALVLDLILSVVQRLVVSPGLTGRSRKARRPGAVDAATPAGSENVDGDDPATVQNDPSHSREQAGA